MELREAIGKRRTIRDFKDRPVPGEVIKYAIENACKAPSYNHSREWDFIVIKNIETKLRLVDSENQPKEVDTDELKRSYEHDDPIIKAMYLEALPKQKKMILRAPVVVVVVFKPKTTIAEATRIYDLNCMASAWACIENFLLSLTEHEVFGVTFIPQNTGRVKAALGIPEELEIAAVIPIGYKADNINILEQRAINISEKIHYEKY